MSNDTSPHSKKIQIALLAATVALIAYLLMNHLLLGDLIDRFPERAFYKTLVYLLWMGCAFAVFAFFVLTVRTLVLGVSLPVFFICLTINYAYALISRAVITPDNVEWMVHETGHVFHILDEFRAEIGIALAKAAALLAVFLIIRALVRRRGLLPDRIFSRRRTATVALTAFLAFHGLATYIQPSYGVAETNVVVFGLPALFSSPPQPGSVPVKPMSEPLARKIIFVLDESVGHKVYEKIVAPKVAPLKVFDFGEAAAIKNCSAQTNALLRWGLKKSEVGHAYDPRTNPMIWGFARAAGFKTTLIDAQFKGALQNFVGKAELALIDELVPANVGLDSDHKVAEMLIERMARPGREFIFVVKRGSHIPYQSNYPQAMAGADASKETRYETAVSYATRRFFELLANQLSRPDLLFIYTSDHGQDLNSRGAHCNPHPSSEEFSVPLFVLTEVPLLRQALGSGHQAMRDRASHLNIFPTLLYGFGYSREWIESSYGPTLAGPPTPYVTLLWHLPYPTRRKAVVDYSYSTAFPGRR